MSERPIYRILFSRLARKAFLDLPKRIQKRVDHKIRSLAVNPRPSGAKALRKRERRLALRVGDYRIIYQVEDDRLLILLIDIRHRRDIYRRL